MTLSNLCRQRGKGNSGGSGSGVSWAGSHTFTLGDIIIMHTCVVRVEHQASVSG